MDKNFTVTKSNYFILNSSYDLSLEEQKIILTLASMVQPQDEEFKPYIFKIAEFMELLGVEDKSKYTQVPKLTKELMRKVFEIHEENKIIQTAWISGVVYEKGSGKVTLKFNPDLKPYMIQLKEKFTEYQLSNVLTMKSKYSPRIYEILKCNEFKKQKYTEIEVETLRKLLKAENIYPMYADFKRKVIQQAQKELNSLTDISFDFEEIKTGRKVTSIKFYIHSNKSRYKAIDEICADTDINVPTTESEGSEGLITAIKMMFEKLIGQNVSSKAANEILQCAKSNPRYGNECIELIKEVLQYSQTQNIERNLIGWFKTTVKNYERPTKVLKKDNFNNYEQRTYDFDSLERKLLGWEKQA
jgi:Protein involved in initiation of plasmid replication